MTPMLRALFPILLLSCAACSHEPPAPALVQEDHQRLVLDILAQTHRVLQLSPEGQRRELQAAGQAFNREKTMATRLRYGTFLAQPSIPGNDDAKAAAVLEPLTMSGTPSVRQLATLLLAQLNERQREEHRSQQLKEQLDELMAIERNLIERNPPRK